MTVGVSSAGLQCSNSTTQRYLQRVVGGTGRLFQSVDCAVAHKWTERTGIDMAGDRQVDRGCARDCYIAWCGHGFVTIVMLVIDSSDWLPRFVGIRGERKSGNLIESTLKS